MVRVAPFFWLTVSLCVCVSLATFPHYYADTNVTWRMVAVPYSCALLGGFVIGTLVSLLWQQRRTRNVSECLYSLYAWLRNSRQLRPAFNGGGTVEQFRANVDCYCIRPNTAGWQLPAETKNVNVTGNQWGYCKKYLRRKWTRERSDCIVCLCHAAQLCHAAWQPCVIFLLRPHYAVFLSEINDEEGANFSRLVSTYHKMLSCCRGTARRAVLSEILFSAAQLYEKSHWKDLQ